MVLTLLKNARVFAGSQAGQEDAENPTQLSSILIKDDTIQEVCVQQRLITPTGAAGEEDVGNVVDLQGRILAPGFIDGHMHLLLFGTSLQKIDLSDCCNLADIRKTIQEAARRDPSSPRILCQGWMHSMTDGKALASDLDDLDEEYNRPIFIDAKDLHSTWCNTAALKELNVQHMPDPPGGKIFRDGDGNPTGLLSEAAAVMLVWPHLAKVASMEQKLVAIREAIKAYNAAGYTGMVDMAMDENAWEALLQLRSRGGLSVRLAAHWLIAPSNTSEENHTQVKRAIDLAKQYNAPDFRIAGIKVICDGVVDACTAALIEPYSSNGISVDPLWETDKLREVVQWADAAGLQCALHAIGDGAVNMAIDALGSVAHRQGHRHRIEHLEVTSPDAAKRLFQYGITASIQAVHADPAILRAWPKLLGERRHGRAFAYREFLDEGVSLALGTDAPTAPNLPLPNLYTATTRRSAREPDETATVNKHFALPLINAITAATEGAAYSCFMDSVTGKITPGKKADFVVLDMEWSAEKLLQAKVYQTWFDGKKVYDISDT